MISHAQSDLVLEGKCPYVAPPWGYTRKLVGGHMTVQDEGGGVDECFQVSDRVVQVNGIHRTEEVRLWRL